MLLKAIWDEMIETLLHEGYDCSLNVETRRLYVYLPGNADGFYSWVRPAAGGGWQVGDAYDVAGEYEDTLTCDDWLEALDVAMRRV